MKAIYFGHRMEVQAREAICTILAGQNPEVELRQASPIPHRFELQFERFTYTTAVEAQRQGRRPGGTE